jgi:cytochrome P450
VAVVGGVLTPPPVQDHRKVSAHLFSANGLRSKMESSFTEHGAKLVELLSTVADSGRVLDWQDVMAGLTFETICEIAFGVDPNAMEPGLRGEKIPFLVQFDRLQQLCAMRFIVPAPIWKTLRWLNVGTERTIREDAENISRYVQKIIQERQASGSWATQDDLLSMYIQTARSTGKEYMETAEYLQDAVLNFMIAGRDTTSSTLTNLFKLLPQNPAAEARMVEEFARVVGRGKHVQWDHVRELRFGGAVFNEVLRMYPPVSGDVRICNQTDTLPSGLVVPAGTRTSITNAAIGRDPSLWSDPDAFNPSRWLGEDPTQPTRRVDEMMHPVFWGGPRLCLGKDMARLEVLSIAWTVLQKFRLDVLPHSELKVNGPVQFYEHGLPVRVQARGAA